MLAKSEPSILQELRELLRTPGPPELGPGARASILPLPALDQKLDQCFARAVLPAGIRDPIRGTILLWHDHLDTAHQIAQALPGADGSLLHAIIHRREPDYSNAKYWFQRAGRHPCFSDLADEAAALLDSKNQRVLRDELLPRGAWDPFAFVDACESAAARPDSDPRAQLLRAIQAIEIQVFLKHLCPPAVQPS